MVSLSPRYRATTSQGSPSSSWNHFNTDAKCLLDRLRLSQRRRQEVGQNLGPSQPSSESYGGRRGQHRDGVLLHLGNALTAWAN